MRKKQSYRTLWLSDLHLGSRNAKPHMALAFLENVECETLYLVGDVFDFHVKTRAWYWSLECQKIVEKIKEISQSGVRVVYTPGNHDEKLRALNGGSVYGIDVMEETVHVTADNRRFLVIHGDQFEAAAKTTGIGDRVGCHLYDALMTIDRWHCRYLTAIGSPHWSLAKFAKLKLAAVQMFFNRFAEVATQIARERDFDGVICGHTHHPQISTYGSTWYCNTGDWVESCCALVEDDNGSLELIHYTGLPLTYLESEVKAALQEPVLDVTSG